MRITGGQFKNRKLHVPSGLDVRPSSGRLKESLFNICQHKIENAQCLDLFAGSGAVGIEALSRGAASCIFVEKDKRAGNALEQNLKTLEIESVSTLLATDVIQALNVLDRRGEQFDFIFLDPPYHVAGPPEESWSWKVLSALDSSQLFSDTCWIFVEDSTQADLEGLTLERLTPERERKMGRSILRHYTVKP